MRIELPDMSLSFPDDAKWTVRVYTTTKTVEVTVEGEVFQGLSINDQIDNLINSLNYRAYSRSYVIEMLKKLKT